MDKNDEWMRKALTVLEKSQTGGCLDAKKYDAGTYKLEILTSLFPDISKFLTLVSRYFEIFFHYWTGKGGRAQ